jgi:CRISPR-associated protein Csb1
MTSLKEFDVYLNDEGPAALLLKQPLMSVEGREGVIFPPTYASGDGFPGGYNIDTDATGKTVALIDSVGSQANRIEPIFLQEKYAKLVPQIAVTAGEKTISILEAGHRAGDALVRCSSLHDQLQKAFNDLLKGDATQLAKIAPTSFVFGVWDSRDTFAKLPRVISSTIRAYNVRKLTRSAQFNPATEYVKDQLLEEPTDKVTKDAYAERGFIHVPATASHGGIIADGGILRTATLGLTAIRLLHAGKDAQSSLKLRRYILGLSLVAFTYNSVGYLRQGCILVVDPDQPREYVEVFADGDRKACQVTHEMAIEYATLAAEDFGVGEDQTVPFDKEKAQRDIKGEGSAKTKAKKGKKQESENADG